MMKDIQRSKSCPNLYKKDVINNYSYPYLQSHATYTKKLQHFEKI